MRSILSPGPISDWKPDPISAPVFTDTEVSLNKAKETSYNTLQDKLSPVVEQERVVLEIVKSLEIDVTPQQYNRTTFSIKNPTYVNDIKAVIAGFIYKYTDTIKVVNSLWNTLPILLGFRQEAVKIVYKLVDLYKKYSSKIFKNPKSTVSISPVKLSTLEIYSDSLVENLPIEFFNSIPIQAYEYVTDLYKALFVLLDELNVERYSENKSDVYEYTLQVSKTLIDLYEYFSYDFMSVVNYDMYKINNLENTLYVLDDIRKQLGYVK